MPSGRAGLAKLLVALAVVLAFVATPGPATSSTFVPTSAGAPVPPANTAPSLEGLGGVLSLGPTPARAPAGISSPRQGSAAGSPVGDSTVFVRGTACGVELFGSGWTVAADTVATTAHVVAGVDDPEVRAPDGRRLRARVVGFDPQRDVAILRVEGLDRPALATGPVRPGTDVLVHGHPGGQKKLDVAPARVLGSERVAISDIYGRSYSSQVIVGLSGDIRSGDSGAAVTTYDGMAVAMVFAVDSLRPGLAYARTSNDVVAVAAASGDAPVDTGPCLF
jgi:S1-C subfamily serine protease